MSPRAAQKEVDPLLFNYRIGDGPQEALAKDAEIRHARNVPYPSWGEAYYDASADRSWTWKDLKRLAVKFSARKVNPAIPSFQIAGVELWVRCEGPEEPVWAWVRPEGGVHRDATMRAEYSPEFGQPVVSTSQGIPMLP